MASFRSFFLYSLQISGILCLGPQISKTGWNVNASSQQAGNEARNAIDGDPATFWHSQYDPPIDFPHTVVVDLGKRWLVDGISVLPRQDGKSNGDIAQHLVQLSQDGQTWGSPVALGTWENSKRLKETSFVARPARYVRLTALTGSSDYPWAAIAEFNVHQHPDPFLDRNGWTVTASSEEVTAENARASLITDGKPFTFWNSRYSSNMAGYPHTILINIGRSTPVSGLFYTPRQYVGRGGAENGRIGQYRIETSTNGWIWRRVADGKWSDDGTDKASLWTAASVRYVRLTALSEAGNRGPRAAIGEIQLMYGDSLASYQAPDPRGGLWPHTVEFPLVPAGVANIPNKHEMLAWSAYANDQYINQNQGKTQTAIWDVTSNAMTAQEVANTQHDMFCPGASMDTTGRFIITGGNDATRTTIYDPFSRQWLRAAEMSVGRGYQSQTTLSDGRVFTIGGSWSGGYGQDKAGEVYDVKSNTWRNLSGCQVAPIMTHDRQGRYRSDNHQWMFAWSNATVFHAGPSQNMAWFGTTNQGSINVVGTRGQDSDSMNGVAVMYDALAGKIFTAGGSPNYQDDNAHKRTHIITLTGVNRNASVQRAPDMNFARGFHSAVALPDGTIFVVGGQSYVIPFTDTTAVLVPELYNPATNTYTQLNGHASPRTYHSTSLLLSDGSVFTGGGGLCGDCATNHFSGEIFLPPYLLNSDGTARTRPVINGVNGETFANGASIRISASTAITSVILMRLGTATHTVNTDQRRLPFKVSGSTVTINVPNDPGVALPGYYFLFVLDSAGTPSVAKTIQITNIQQAPASAGAVPALQVLHTNSEPERKTSVNDFLGVSNLTTLLESSPGSVRREFRS